MKKESLTSFFASILSFQDNGHTDYFMRDKGILYEAWKTHGKTLSHFKNRVKFHYLGTTKLLHEKDRKGFEAGIDIVFDLLQKLEYNIDKDKNKDEEQNIKPKKRKSLF